jgi:outer membrane protein assembly factor BamB
MRTAGAVLALLLLTSLPARAQDWPGWRGAGRDGKLAGFKAPAAWPKELQRGWQVEVGEGYSTPALVGDRLYMHTRQGENEVILCLDTASGKELWRDSVAAPYEINPTAKEQGKGPKSSPAVAGDRVYALGMSRILSCLDAKTGRIVWRHDFPDPFPKTDDLAGTSASPLIHEGLCIAHVGGEEKAEILALDAATGQRRWAWGGDGASYASPIVATIGGKPQLITLTVASAVGLAPADGKLLWRTEFTTDYKQNIVTPVVLGNLAIFSGYKKGVVAHRVDGSKPEEAWQTNDVSMYMSSPVLQGERLFGFSEKRKGQFFCLDAKTGKTLWTGEGRQGESASLLDGGDVLLGLTSDAELIVFDASDKDYVEKARYKVAETETWAHPVVSGRTIYVKDKTKLTRWNLP